MFFFYCNIFTCNICSLQVRENIILYVIVNNHSCWHGTAIVFISQVFDHVFRLNAVSYNAFTSLWNILGRNFAIYGTIYYVQPLYLIVMISAGWKVKHFLKAKNTISSKWRIRKNYELETLFQKTNVVNTIRNKKLQWVEMLGVSKIHFYQKRVQEQNIRHAQLSWF